MNLALDISPISDERKVAHRVRGTGFYIDHLRQNLVKYFPNNNYFFFNSSHEIPKDIDVVHIPYFEPFFFTLPFFKRYKTIVTIHDLTPFVFPDQFPSGIKGSIKWGIQKLLLSSIDGIITDSDSSKKDIIAYANIPEKKITVIYLAVGGEFKKKIVSNSDIVGLFKRYKLPEKFVLYVGDATWNKNLPRLIEAVSKVGLPLVLVGSALKNTHIDITNTWNKDLIKTQQLIHNNKNITPLGFVPTEDLVSLYNIATVFVMPSLYEGFGLPLLEAMSSGCPVVTSRTGSIEEVAGHAAYYVDPQSIESISEGIMRVFSDKNMQRELSEKGLRQARKFNWKKTVEATMSVYEKTHTYNN